MDGKREKPGFHIPLPAIGFLLPNFIGFLFFVMFPVILSLIMAFTNWTINPGVPLEYVGLRNFNDLLGMHSAIPAAAGHIYASYVSCVILLLAGLILYIWSYLREWEGVKIGGTVACILGLSIIITAFANHVNHGFVLAGIILLLAGIGVSISEKGSWKPGIGIIPSILLVVSISALWFLNKPMWDNFTPNDPRFWKFFYNTVYLMLGTPIGIFGSLALALLLNDRLPESALTKRAVMFLICAGCGFLSLVLGLGSGHGDLGLVIGIIWLIAGLGLAFNVIAYRTIYYLPSFTAGVAIMILWKALYNPQTGPINIGLSYLTGTAIDELPKWLSSFTWAKPSLIFMGTWVGIGGMNMLLYLAALSNVPQDLIDAAEVDGASRWQKFRHITIPQLAPTTFFICIMSVIGGLQGGLEQARVMTGGGPDGATTTLSYYLYNMAFQNLNMGYASAIAWIMFAIIFVATALNWRFGKELEVE